MMESQPNSPESAASSKKDKPQRTRSGLLGSKILKMESHGSESSGKEKQKERRKKRSSSSRRGSATSSRRGSGSGSGSLSRRGSGTSLKMEDRSQQQQQQPPPTTPENKKQQLKKKRSGGGGNSSSSKSFPNRSKSDSLAAMSPKITWKRGMTRTSTATGAISWTRAGMARTKSSDGRTTKSSDGATGTTNTTTGTASATTTTATTTGMPRLPTSTMPRLPTSLAIAIRDNGSRHSLNSSSSSSGRHRHMNTSYVSRQSHISIESDCSDNMFDDDEFIMAVTASTNSLRAYDEDDDLDPSNNNNNKSDPRSSPKSFWKTRSQREVVDQQVNLMDAETGQYEKQQPAGGGATRGLGYRQKSLVEIFLQDESSSRSSNPHHNRKHQRGLGLGESLTSLNNKERNDPTQWCLMYVFLGLLFLGALIVALPAAFGRTNHEGSGGSSLEVTTSPTIPTITNPPQPQTTTAAPTEEEFIMQKEETQQSLSHIEFATTGSTGTTTQADNEEVVLDIAAIPTSSRQAAMHFLVIDQDISMADSFADENSAPSKALKWISEEDPAHLPIPGMDDDNNDAVGMERQLVQRYGMAVFYFSQQEQQATNPNNGDEEGTRRELVKATTEELKRREQFDQHWTSQDPVCDWPGVECNANQMVMAINVSYSLLGGTLPRELFQGSTFPTLTVLDVSHNQLEGTLPHLYESNPVKGASMVPSDNALESLLLQHNRIEGNIDSIVSLEQLTTLDLSNNDFTGHFPAELGTKLKRLETIDLGRNRLEGMLPAQLSALSKLKHLDLEGNLFEGTIPHEWSDLTELQALSLAQCKTVDGTIPSALSNMSDLKELRLQNTNLEGSIPSFLGDMVQLQELYLHNTGLVGTMPENICSLVGKTGLRVLTSDCSDLLGKVSCSCCTDCLME